MLADSEMEILPAGSIRLDVSRAFMLQRGLVRRAEVGGTTYEPGDILCEHVQHFSGCFAPRDSLRVGGENGKVAVPTVRKIAALHEINFGGEFGIFCAIGGEELCPLNSGLRTAGADSSGKVIVNAFRNQKLCVFGPSVAALG